jgi:hypothetical protein
MSNKKPITERTRDKILERIKVNPHASAYNSEMIERMVAWAQANERDKKIKFNGKELTDDPNKIVVGHQYTEPRKLPI